jgi:hypothetical protein
MTAPPPAPSPESRHRADARLRRLTRSVVLAAAGATALLGVVVAKEHPGAAPAPGSTPVPPTTTPAPTPSSGTVTSTPRPTAPTTTTTRPVVTSGGTGR